MLSIEYQDYSNTDRLERTERHRCDIGVPVLPRTEHPSIIDFFKMLADRHRLARSQKTLRKLSNHLLADIGLERRNVMEGYDGLCEAQSHFLDEYRRLQK